MKRRELPIQAIPAVLATIGLYYALGSLGAFLAIKSGDRGLIVLEDGPPWLLTIQIASMYLVILAAKVPAAFVLGSFLGLSVVRAPHRISVLVVIGVELLTFIFRLLRWPLKEMDLIYAQLPALLIEILGILTLAIIASISTVWTRNRRLKASVSSPNGLET